MKHNFTSLIKKKIYRGISLVLSVAMVLSIFPTFKLQASADGLPVPVKISTTDPFLFNMFYNPTTSTFMTNDNNNYSALEYDGPNYYSFSNDQKAIAESGGAYATFHVAAATESFYWSWYSLYLQIDGNIYYCNDPSEADVYCSFLNANIPFFENKGEWVIREVKQKLPYIAHDIRGDIFQPKNDDPLWGDRDYGWRGHTGFKSGYIYIEFSGSDYDTKVKTTPTASTIISGQTLESSSFSDGKVVTCLSDIHVENASPISGAFLWANPAQQLTSTSTVSANFVPNYNNFNNPPSFTVSVPVRAAVISLNRNGGFGGSSSVDGWYNFKPANISIPTRSGYAFKGYYSSASGGTQYYNASGISVKNWDIAADTTLCAQWEAYCTITTLSAPSAITPGNTLSLTTPTITGDPTSQGWQYSANGSTDWTNFDPSIKTFALSENGYSIRYYAVNAAGTTYSNTVQITVNKYTPALSISAAPASTIYPANVVLSSTLTGADSVSAKEIKFYEGTTLLATSTTDSSGKATCTITSPTASTHSYKAVFEEDPYNIAASSSVLSFTASKGTQSAVSYLDASDITKTYGDTTFTLPLVSGGSGTGAYSYRSSDTAVATVSGNTVTVKDTGEAIIYVKKLGDSNYNDSEEVSLKVIVSPKPVTISGMHADSKVYDGTVTTTVDGSDAVINGIINDDPVSIDYTNATASFNNKNAAANKTVNFSGFALTGSNADNYTLSAQPLSTTSTISQKAITVSGITASNKDYDGNISATLVYTNTVFNGIIAEDNLTVSATGTYSDKDVSTNKTVTISSITLGGEYAGNYKLATSGNQSTTTANIDTRTITVTPNTSQSKYYGSADPVLTYSFSGAAGTEKADFSGALQRANGETIGDYAINLGTLALKDGTNGFLAKNYSLNLSAVNVPFAINAYDPLNTMAIEPTPNGTNSWFCSGDIVLTAPSGFEISTSNALSANTWTATIKVDNADGQKNAIYYLKNKTTGAITIAKTFDYKTDATIPSNIKVAYASNQFFSVLNTSTFGLFFKDTVEVTLTADDATSGVKEFTYTLGEETKTITATNGTASFSIEPQFKGNISNVSATDNAGNKSSNTSYENFVIDANVPTSPIVSGYTSGTWTTTDVTLALSGSTADSDIKKYQYKENNEKDWTDIDSSNSISFDTTQNKTYLLRAVSNSGVEGTATNINVCIDKTAPTIAVSGNTTDYLQSNKIDVTPTAGISGISKVEVQKDSGDFTDITTTYASGYTITSNGKYTFKVTNGTGSTDTDSITYANIDTTKPVVSINSNGYTENTWKTSGNITLEVSNTALNLGETTYEYKIGTGTWQAYTAPVVISSDITATTYAFRATSESGVVSDEQTIVVKRDTAAPDGDIKIATDSIKTSINNISFGLFFKEDVDVAFEGTDTISGVADIKYYRSETIKTEAEIKALSDSDWTAYSSAICEAAVDGTKFVYYAKITDHAGNISYIGSTGITFDTTAPVITGITDGATYYVTQKAEVTDANINAITLNGAVFTSGQNLTGNTSATYKIVAVDKVDNSTTATVTMKTIGSISSGIALLTAENVKSIDKSAIEDAKAILDAIDLKNATDAEKQEVEDAIINCETLLDKICSTANEIDTVASKINSTTLANVKSSDKENLDSALIRINNLLSRNNLTDSERADLDTKKALVTDLLNKLNDIQTPISSAKGPVKGITIDNVAKADRPALEKALSDLQAILIDYTNNLTDSEKKDIQDQIKLIEDILKSLDEVNEVEALINALPDPNNVTKDDVAEITSAKDAYVKLTDHQKSLVESTFKTKLDNLVKASRKFCVVNALTSIKIEGIDGTDFDLRTELVVKQIKDTLPKAAMDKFALSVNELEDGQAITTLYDIRLLLNGQPVQPNGKVKVTLTLTQEQANYTDLKIIYIADDGTITIIPSTINGNEISFITDHFSNYGIIGKPIKNALPVTGEDMPYIPYILVLTLLSAIVLIVLMKRRKDNSA